VGSPLFEVKTSRQVWPVIRPVRLAARLVCCLLWCPRPLYRVDYTTFATPEYIKNFSPDLTAQASLSLGRLPLANLEHLFYNCSWHGTAFRFVPFILHNLFAILFRKREMMALPLGLPPPTAYPPLVSPELGVSKRKHAGQPGKKDPRRHGFCAARHPHPAALALDNFG